MEKTCGNCNIADFDLMRCDYFDDNGEHEAITKNKPACEDWIKRVLTDEERYQQLAEVARDMLKFLKNIEREYPRLLEPNHKPGGQILYPMPSDEYANQLEELGVEL